VPAPFAHRSACPPLPSSPLPTTGDVVALTRPVPRRSATSSALGLVADRFAVLDSEGVVLIDGRQIDGLPDRLLGLAETRSWLLHPATPFTARDAALNWIISRTKAQPSGDWGLVLAGMLLPGLHATLSGLVRVHPRWRRELEAEALTGLYAAAATAPLDGERVASRLTWAARRAANRYRIAEQRTQKVVLRLGADLAAFPADPGEVSFDDDSTEPDELLVLAVHLGVLLAEDATLIASTRLHNTGLRQAAAWLEISYAAAGKRRSRAEAQLALWLRHRLFLAAGRREQPWAEFVQNLLAGAGCSGGGRPRQGQRPDPKSGVRQSDQAHQEVS
jgi:hypothetical protein